MIAKEEMVVGIMVMEVETTITKVETVVEAVPTMEIRVLIVSLL